MACLLQPSAVLHRPPAPGAALHVTVAHQAGGSLTSRRAALLAGGGGWLAGRGQLGNGPQLQRATPSDAADAAPAGSGGGGGSGNSSSGTLAPYTRGGPGGSQLSPVPDVDAEQLLRSLGLDGAADPAALLARLRKLPGVRQQGVLDSAVTVTTHLRSPAVGLTRQQAAQLLQRCPELFSWPPEQRAAALFGELMGAELTAAAAAQCFIAFPEATVVTSLAPGLAELAAILAHSQDKEGCQGRRAAVPAAQRTVAALLTQTPSTVMLVCSRTGYLQRRAAELQQAGFSAADVAALAWERPGMLCADAAARVASRAAVVQQELGLPAAAVVSLAARCRPAWLSSSADTLRGRAAALAEGFGQPAAAAMLMNNAAVLNCDTAVWRRNLCYMAACGVADPKALLLKWPKLLHVDHAAPDLLQRRLLLQRGFGLTAAQLYQSAYPLTYLEPGKLAQRLQFVEQRGQAHRLVAKAARGRKPTTASTEEQLPALSIVALTRKADQFLAAVGASQAEWEAWAAAHPPAACPLYVWAQQEAAAEEARLAAALPPELAQYAAQPHRRFIRQRQGN